MGMWADTFGGGNSFAESVANVSTPDDGMSYQGGSLVDESTGNIVSGGVMDSGLTGQGPNGTSPVGQKSTGHGESKGFGGLVKGITSNVFGTPNMAPKGKTKGTYNPISKNVSRLANILGVGAVLSIPSKLGSAMSFANGIKPENQKFGKFADSKGVMNQVYSTNKGLTYSYNALNMPYEVSIVDGKMVDTLSMDVDKDGNKPGDPNFDPSSVQQGVNSYDFALQNTPDGEGDEVRKYQNANLYSDYADAPAYGQPGSIQAAGQFDDFVTGNPMLDNVINAVVNESGAYNSVLDMARAAGFSSIEGDQREIIANAIKYLDDRDMDLSGIITDLDPNTTGTVLEDFAGLEDINMPTVSTAEGQTVQPVAGTEASTYDAATNILTEDMMATGAEGEINSNNLVDIDDVAIDIQAEAKGEGVMGNALDNFASQNISSVINTSTVDGKMLAQTLGEGNYTDHKATLLGQVKLISEEFKDSNGNAKIPSWAQADLRGIQQTISFGGMTGTAATQAYANAIMEATIGVADKEAAFFQTLTIKNLDNRQESIINKAKILAQFEMGNLDARETAAVQNAKAFLEMDISNLSNAQQAMVINKQAMVDALFKNTEAINAQALFTAEGRNDMAKFYDELNASIQRHNATEMNALTKFNAGEINDNSEFLADIKNSRQQYVANMQYQIDKMNATWRQDVATTNNQNKFDAASTDIKNALDITQEAQNALWDDADSLLDYIWRSADNDQQRELMLLTAQLSAQSGQKDSGNSFWKGVLSIGGSILGSGSTPWWLGGDDDD